MKINSTTRKPKRTYALAILIAILFASILPLQGFALSSNSGGQVGSGKFTLQVLRDIPSPTGIEVAYSVQEQANLPTAPKTGIQLVSASSRPVVVAAAAEGIEEAVLPEATVEADITEAVVVEPPVAEVSLPAFISLSDFSQQVSNGNGGQITGIYSNNLFALSVVQQPSGQPGFVSTSGNTTTQFGMASSLGFLAHNYLSGSLFSYLSAGSSITVVYGDGNTQSYRVSQVRKFLALSPESASSDFVDLASGATLSAADLFYQTYGVSGQLVLQTCISSNGVGSWGRLFVIATPSN
jgi:hypothetical protein